MLKKSRFVKILILTVILTFSAGLGLAFAKTTVPQKSSLNGIVTSESLVKVGTMVKEGDILVKVKTLVGSMPAVRSNCNGKVVQILARAGMEVKVGQALVIVEK